MAHAAFNWFDFVVVIVLALGIWSGRRTGALPQLFGFVQWTLVLLICSFLYSWPANALARTLQMQPDVMALIIYPIEVSLMYWLVGIGRRRIEKKVEKKELFGKGEYYAAMAIGIARSLAILLVAMAWLHGRYFTADDMREYETFCTENFGGIRLPTLCTTKDAVFNHAFTGRMAQNYFGAALVAAIPAVQYAESSVAEHAPTSAPKAVQLREASYGSDNSAGAQLSDREGKERKTRENSGTIPVPAAAANAAQIVYHHLTLHGISGAGDKQLALINNRALAKGESDVIKVDDHKVHIRVLQIRAQAVSVQVENNPEPIDLTLGQATGLDGKIAAK